MSTPAHTPLKVLPVFIENSPIKYGVLTGKWGQPALAICDQEENAKAIAFACNSHAALVAALREQTAAVENWGRLLNSRTDELSKTIRYNAELLSTQARAALAAARE